MNKELIELSHKYKMEEIQFELDCKKDLERFKHEKELERGRIKSAEIRKTIERKGDLNFMRDYSK